MIEKLLKTIKSKLPECNKLPERVKEILNKVNKSLNDLDENDSKQLWILLCEFIKETSVIEDAVNDKELLVSYQCILNLTQLAINFAEDIISVYNKDEHLLKTIMIFQSLYPKKFEQKFKLEIAKMYSSFWTLLAASTKNKPDVVACFGTIMTQNFIFTFDYLFDAIKVTTKKLDMKTLSTLLWELCKTVSTLSSNQNIMNIIVSNLEKNMKNTLFLETETGQMTIADVFTTNQQLFLKFHQIIKRLLPKANKSEAKAYGEIYFIGWINSNSSMREVIEQGIFDIIDKTLTLKRTGLALRTYHNALILLQSMQNHRKHLMFSKVITNLYAPILWRQLRSEFNEVRWNATEILARAYPLEKRGEGREISSRFLIKQQNAFLDQLEDICPHVRVAAIKGVCCCMRYFWNSFEDDQINKYFYLCMRLISDSVFEVRRVVYFGFCQLLDETRSHVYFKNPSLLAKMKNTLNDDNEKVRRAFIHFLLKIKKLDNQNTTTDKINFAEIVNLNDTAKALSYEDNQNGFLLVELIFDNFIGDKVPDRNVTLTRFKLFYRLNPTACRKLMMYSEKVLDFNSACKLIFSFLKTIYSAIVKKEARLRGKDKENVQNDIPTKKRKSVDNSDNTSDTSSSSCNSSTSNHDDNDHNDVCCILDCVHALLILHRDKFIDDNNSQLQKDIQDSCVKSLVKILKFYKEGDAYFSAMSLASLIPVSKLTPHVPVTSTALSILKQLPYDVRHAEEEIDVRKVDCLVNTLCSWKRGYEILQLINVWFDEAFKTLSLNDTQYPEHIVKEGKRVRFKIDAEECKPMTGILLIKYMANNLATQEYLFNSDINKRNFYDLILYLQRVKPAIENRISADNVLSNLLSDELLVELFGLNMKLSTLYYSRDKDFGVDEIIKYQTSVLDWVINNLLIFDLHHKNESTITLAVKIINEINYVVMRHSSMAFVNTTFLDNFFTFSATLLHNYLGPRVLLTMIGTLAKIAKHLHYLKLVDKLKDTTSLTSCVCSIISVLSESNFNENLFKSIIGEPKHFRCELTMVILETYKTNIVEFKQIFMTLIETIMNIITNKIREIDEIDLNEQLTEMPFAAYQLTTVILSNAKLRKYFSSNAVDIFSSNIYKNNCVLLLSAISFIYTLSFQSSHLKGNDLEQVVKLLFKTLMEHGKTTTLLGNNCTIINNTNMDQQVSILETSDFNYGIMDFLQKGRSVLAATAKQLHITLSLIN